MRFRYLGFVNQTVLNSPSRRKLVRLRDHSYYHEVIPMRIRHFPGNFLIISGTVSTCGHQMRTSTKNLRCNDDYNTCRAFSCVGNAPSCNPWSAADWLADGCSFGNPTGITVFGLGAHSRVTPTTSCEVTCPTDGGDFVVTSATGVWGVLVLVQAEHSTHTTNAIRFAPQVSRPSLTPTSKPP